MSIPKIIHYCWFGGKPKPELAEKCIKSWKKHCPDYEIREWNEDNYDLAAAPLYVRQAYEAKKWAFVTDYVRLQVVYECGGIYLDTDVELKKNLDSLLGYSAYFGFEDGKWIATGLGFGAEQGTPILQELMDDYRDIPFLLEDGSEDAGYCYTAIHPMKDSVLLAYCAGNREEGGCLNRLRIRKVPLSVFAQVPFSPFCDSIQKSHKEGS